MARNVPDPSKRTTPSRVTKSPVVDQSPPTWAKKGRDRRRMWIQIVAGLLVLAMMLPIIAAFL